MFLDTEQSVREMPLRRNQFRAVCAKLIGQEHKMCFIVRNWSVHCCFFLRKQLVYFCGRTIIFAVSFVCGCCYDHHVA